MMTMMTVAVSIAVVFCYCSVAGIMFAIAGKKIKDGAACFFVGLFWPLTLPFFGGIKIAGLSKTRNLAKENRELQAWIEDPVIETRKQAVDFDAAVKMFEAKHGPYR